mmetsp:Transcript_15147/g.28511  ORF Transcript_15147/g.28511 Transcript_15147/m.28511 type:complete len:250 (-) Transcript_15147:1524-2273(-)
MADEFSRDVTRQAIARAALALDFKEANEEVMDVLAEVMHRYIETIGVVSQSNAELAGRAYPGTQDVIAALDNEKFTTKTQWRELSAFAFGKSDHSSASTTAQSSTTSSAGKSTVWSQPFPFPVPSFPCAPPVSDSKQQPFGRKITPLEQAPPAHFPAHFPPFPPAHTYKSTSTASTSVKRAASSAPDEAQQRAKRLQVAKNMQQSITALEEIEDKSKGFPEASAGLETGSSTGAGSSAGNSAGVPTNVP